MEGWCKVGFTFRPFTVGGIKTEIRGKEPRDSISTGQLFGPSRVMPYKAVLVPAYAVRCSFFFFFFSLRFWIRQRGMGNLRLPISKILRSNDTDLGCASGELFLSAVGRKPNIWHKVGETSQTLSETLQVATYHYNQ